MNWTYAKRQAGTLGLLMLAIYSTVHIGLDLVEDDPNWVSEWLAIIGAPMWWWSVIRRIATDVLTEARDDALRSIEKRHSHH
jgi:hypothetical protein